MVNSLRTQRDQYADDLHQVEKSFTELHKRYDKLREALQNQRKNEDKLKEELADTKQKLRSSSQSFEVRDNALRSLFVLCLLLPLFLLLLLLILYLLYYFCML